MTVQAITLQSINGAVLLIVALAWALITWAAIVHTPRKGGE